MGQEALVDFEKGGRFLPLKTAEPGGTAVKLYREVVSELEEALRAPEADRYRVSLEFLYRIYHPGDPRTYDEALSQAAGDPIHRAWLLNLDARNVTLEPDYYRDIDEKRYAMTKPLIWMWRLFDQSPLGENCDLGFQVRRLLAGLVFRHCGENVRIFPGLEITYGYNLVVGENVAIHRQVLLDDRGGIVIGHNVSLADHVHVYSHQHCINDPNVITMLPTIIEDGVRVTYHATVLAGTRLEHDSMIGAMGVQTKDTRRHGIYVGIPAKKVKEKRERCEYCKRRHNLECLLFTEKEQT